MFQTDARTTPVTLRQANVAARRRRILDAARRLIAIGGTQALSMRKLADEAGLSVTTLYNLYGVRAEILEALIVDAVDRIVEVLDAEAPLDDPLERCRAVVTVSVRYIDEHEAMFRPMFLAAFEGLALSEESDRRLAARCADMQRVGIEEAIAQGLLHDTLDPMRLGEQIYHGYELASVQWACGQLDAEGFEARALYGLYVALLAVATDAVRPTIVRELKKLEKKLGRAIPPGSRTTPDRRKETR